MREDDLKRGRNNVLIWMALLLVAAALVSGCGKKAPPKLSDVEAPGGVDNLSVALEEDEIVLTWTAPDADAQSGPAGYHVYRSAEPAGEEACRGCPVLFRRVAKVPLAAQPSGGRPLIYRELAVPGTRYLFKVVSFDAAGRLGPDSNIVRIVAD
jgi:hypothetical protein